MLCYGFNGSVASIPWIIFKLGFEITFDKFCWIFAFCRFYFAANTILRDSNDPILIQKCFLNEFDKFLGLFYFEPRLMVCLWYPLSFYDFVASKRLFGSFYFDMSFYWRTNLGFWLYESLGISMEDK